MKNVEIVEIVRQEACRCQQSYNNPTLSSFVPTYVNQQTQEHPRVLDVASSSGSVCSTVTIHGDHNIILYASKPTHTADATDPLSRSDTSSRDKADLKAFVRSVVSSNAHLDYRGEDIVLNGVQSYPQASTESCSDSCYYVSTANRHIFRDRSAFESYQCVYSISVQAKASVERVCQGIPQVYASGRGTVRVEGRCGDRVSSILLRDVLHVPSGHSNLISGARLDRAGVTTTLGNGRVTLSFEEANIMDGQICDDMYCLNLSVIRPIEGIDFGSKQHF